MKYLQLIFIFTISIIVFSCGNTIHAEEITLSQEAENLEYLENKSGKDRNNTLNTFGNISGYFKAGNGGAEDGRNLLFRVARDMKNLFFIIATVYLLSVIVRMFFAAKTQDEIGKFRNSIIWTGIGMIVMQIAYLFVNTLYGETGVNAGLADRFSRLLIEPLVGIFEAVAGFIFIGVAVIAFYRLVTANGDEEKIKKGKITIVHAIMGYITIFFSKTIVHGIYGKVDCGNDFIQFDQCIRNNDIGEAANIVVTIIDWLNGFIGIAMVILIIYAGYQVVFSNGDEEKLKKAKTSILYIAIGFAVLIMSWLILTFFIGPDKII